MVIEFFGLSGSGKSTLSNILHEKLIEKNIEVERPLNIVGIQKNYIKRNIFKFKSISKNIFEDIGLKIFFLKLCFKYNSFFIGICIFYNFLYYLALINNKNNNNKIIVMDEGIVQSFLAIFLNSGELIEDMEVLNVVNKLKISNYIVAVQCDKNILMNRLKFDQKKRRINKLLDDEYKIDNLFKNYQLIKDKLHIDKIIDSNNEVRIDDKIDTLVEEIIKIKKDIAYEQ